MSQWQSGGSSSSVRVVAGGVVVEATVVGPTPVAGPPVMAPHAAMPVPPGAVMALPPGYPHPAMMAPHPHPAMMAPGVYAHPPVGLPHPAMAHPHAAMGLVPVHPAMAPQHPMMALPPGHALAHPAMAHPHAAMMPRALPAGGVFAAQTVPRVQSHALAVAAPERGIVHADESGDFAPISDERRDGEARTAQGAFLLAVSASLMALGGLMAAAVGAAAPGVLVLAGAGTIAAGVTGLRLLRSPKAPPAGSAGSVPASLQQRILQAAHDAGGRLTVTGTARTLNIALEDAEAALGSMSKSGYVDVEIDSDSGVVQYVFRELVTTRGALPAPATPSTPPSTTPSKGA